jgi:hypothetical protein
VVSFAKHRFWKTQHLVNIFFVFIMPQLKGAVPTPRQGVISHATAATAATADLAAVRFGNPAHRFDDSVNEHPGNSDAVAQNELPENDLHIENSAIDNKGKFPPRNVFVRAFQCHLSIQIILLLPVMMQATPTVSVYSRMSELLALVH